jgi:hypothetical protein
MVGTNATFLADAFNGCKNALSAALVLNISNLDKLN